MYKKKVKDRKKKRAVTKKVGKKSTKNKINKKRNQNNKEDTGSMNMDTSRIKDTFKKADISGGDDTLNTSVLNKDNTDKKKEKRTTEENTKKMQRNL